MKILLLLCVLLCAALSVRAATVLSAEDVASFVPVEAVEESVQQAPENEGINGTPQVRVRFCPGNWHYYQFKCYLMVNLDRTWSDAQSYCSSQQANLASAHSLPEYGFLQSLAGDEEPPTAWIGGYYFESRWRWVDGTAFDYQNWYKRYSTSGNWQCLHLNSYGTRGWSNDNCGNRRAFICSIVLPIC